MRKIFLLLLICICHKFCFTQNKTYNDSLREYINDYIKDHGVIKGNDKKYLQFYPINEKFKFKCRFERTENTPWFQMETSGPLKKTYRVYGKIFFTLNDTSVSLYVYQSKDLMKTEQFKDYLFIPFMDATTGEETYESGRYVELSIPDIISGQVIVDFNKAYNPYCAYTTGYNCPVPPKENRIAVAIKAGERKYLKSSH